jgi:hypothetical protein
MQECADSVTTPMGKYYPVETSQLLKFLHYMVDSCVLLCRKDIQALSGGANPKEAILDPAPCSLASWPACPQGMRGTAS